MTNAIIGLLAETSLHPGTEQSTGVVDLPVAREVSTGYPVIVGSSLKGALKDMARQMKCPKLDQIFGKPEYAGAVAVTDARLLMLPVRSLTGHFKWVTCPYLLERLQRDRALAGLTSDVSIPEPQKLHAVTGTKEENIFLEELNFTVTQDKNLSSIVTLIEPLIYHQAVVDRLPEQLVILNDDDFKYFASYGLQINARNVLDDESKTSKNLWYEETLPPDSLFYSLLLTRPHKHDALAEVKQVFDQRPYLQVGGNETVGQGWCAVAWLEGGNANG